MFLILSGFFVGLAGLFSSGIVLLYSPRKLLNRTWTVFSLCVALWGFGFALTIAASSYSYALLFARGHNLIALFIPITFIHFVNVFLEKIEFKRSRIIYFGYMLTFIYFMASILFPSTFVSSMSVKINGCYYANPGAAYILFPVVFVVIASIGVLQLFLGIKQMSDPQTRRQANILLWGFCFGFSGGASTFPLVFNLPIYPFGLLGVVAYVLLVTYTFTKYGLLDIKVIITRASAYLVTVMLALSTLLLVFVFPKPWATLYLVCVGLAWTFLGGKFNLFLITKAEKRFLRGRYDLQTLLYNLSQELVYLFDRTQIIRHIGEEFAKSMELERVHAIVLESDHYSVFSVKWKSGQNNQIKTGFQGCIESERRLIHQFFKLESEPVFLEKLPRTVQLDLENLGISSQSLVLPINSSRVEGVMILGPKLTEEKFSQNDISVFSFIINQIKVVFERIEYQEKLRLSNQKLKSMNIELERRVEEEVAKHKHALHIAQELSHKAALATLATGIAHEIRNPMASMQSHMLFVAEKFGGVGIETVSDSDNVSMMTWQYCVSSDDFLSAAKGDQGQAGRLFKRLQDEGYLAADGTFTNKLSSVALDTRHVELGGEFSENIELIRSELLGFLKLTALYNYINVAYSQYNRILSITANMMRYGVSGGGVKKDSFTQIEGISEEDSEVIFKELIRLGYLDDKGCVLEKFVTEDPRFKVVLSEHYASFEVSITQLIRNTPGATKKLVYLHKILNGAMSILTGDARKKRITILAEYGDLTPRVMGDELRLHQAFFNVLFNAVQALDKKEMEDPKIVRVGTVPIEFLGHHGVVVKGIEIRIEDNGPGIPESIQSKIFDPFFTTKGPTGGKNAGLGLSILKDVILNHNGLIEIDSELGKGTIFRIRLPFPK